MTALLLVLSLVVSLDIFWTLRQPGWTLAGDADCRITEHRHDRACLAAEGGCPLQEHVHTLRCYSNNRADVETQLDWQKMFKKYPYTGDLRTDLVGIAQTQVGYSESEKNFEVGNDGVRRGYTRYGEWYGSPYGDWSAMFVSFCLNYAGADPSEFPPNIGAASMAELWKNNGRFIALGSYDPVSGDLVFFDDNTVGIVVKVYSAMFYCITGDDGNFVTATPRSLADESIVGWGVVGDVPEPTAPELTEEQLLDISNGPALYIIEGRASKSSYRGYSLRSPRAVIDLIPYLEANGGNYFFTLLDTNNQELPKDESGNYVVIADEEYKLTLSFTAPEGFLPGTYQYQIPNGLLVDGGEGTFVLKDGTNVGSWVVTDEGLITLNFNENMNSRTDITISATLGIHFPDSNDPIDFDGKISVTIHKPDDNPSPTVVTKWGVQGAEGTSGKTDDTRIYWNVSITGSEGSNIVGNVITDNTISGEWIGEQHYSDADMAEGLRFGASDPYYNWHAWTVYPGDPNLTWTEKGWSYRMPETISCWCGQVTLGNEGWIYYIDYSSTPDRASSAGTLYYMNRVTVDGQYADGGATFTHGEMHGEVYKSGSYVADANGGAFLWEIQATIPAIAPGEQAKYNWYLMDNMYLFDSNGINVGPAENDAHLSTVTATYNGHTIPVPRIQDSAGEMFVWDNAWTAVSGGVNYGREINLLCRCQCTADTCRFWDNGCEKYWYDRGDGVWIQNDYCLCWTATENVVFTLIYKTEDLSTVEQYGSLNYKLYNVAELYYKPDGGTYGTLVDNDQVGVKIPEIFEKTLTHDFDGYTAHYKITLNEAKLVLTDGSPLTIHDMMTPTLAFISGSLVITAEDASGNVVTLVQGKDFTVSYDGTGSQTDENGKEVHVLDIVILHPQPVTYTLDYDATLIIPPGTTQAIKYNNSATITLWGEDIKDTSTEKVFAEINIAAKSYEVMMYKTCATTGKPLGGATFGLYNEHGGLITTDVTDANGELYFKTNIIEGIILREHILYYMQELAAPPGYQLDDEPYWFCFCDTAGDYCAVCEEVLAGVTALRIPFEQIGKAHITNQMLNYDLPATGGTGIYPLILVSVTFIVIPLVYGCIHRRKRERRRDV